jgi:hypothetical protein
MLRIAAASLFGLMLVACVADEDLGTVDQESHSWGSYHWARTSNPFNLKVGDNVSSAWDSYLNTSVSDWSRSTVLDLTKVAGQASGPRCKGTTGRVEVCNRRYGNNGWLGIASISITGGNHITLGTVKVNDTYFDTGTYNTPAWRNLVMCQEIGHTFGLDHQDEDFDNQPLGTCMDYSSDPVPNQHPNAHDYDQLQTIYAHLDSTTTVGAAVPDTSAESVEGWGHLVASSHGGMVETYRRDFGNGTSVVTHVVWAE